MARANQSYNKVEPSEDAQVVAPTTIESNSGSTRFFNVIVTLGLGLTVLFITGSIFYAQHCAQLFANEIRGTVYWSPQLAAVFAVFGLFSQVMLVSIPFQRRYQNPVLERYKEEGYHTVAKILKREVQVKGKSKIHKVVLVYQPVQDDPTAVYAKKVEVKEKEFIHTEFPIVVIPSVPTSAILKRVYTPFTESCGKQTICRAVFSLVAPILWVLVISYDQSMAIYSQTDFWDQWGLGLLFVTSLISSILWGYVMVISQVKQWLNGGACRIETSRIPPGLFGETTPALRDDAGYEDEATAQPVPRSALELV